MSQSVVIDNGSYSIRIGRAGENVPTINDINCVLKVPAKNEIYGREALKYHLNAVKPVKNGIIVDLSTMGKIWNHHLTSMNVDYSDTNFLITQHNTSLNSKKKILDYFFNTLNAKSVGILPSSVLTLIASGRTSGCTVQVGEGLMSACCIVEGFIHPHTSKISSIGGCDVNEYFRNVLAGYSFINNLSVETTRLIKHEICEVSEVPLIGIANHIRDIADYKYTLKKANIQPMKFTLPDGTEFEIGSERAEVLELLFQPSMFGIDVPGLSDLVVDSLRLCDPMIKSMLQKNIVIHGGQTLCKGFLARTLRDVKKKSSQSAFLKIHAAANRSISCYLGGSMFAIDEKFVSELISKQEYQELADSMVYRLN